MFARRVHKDLVYFVKACRQYLLKISYFKNSWAARWNPLYYHHSQRIMMLTRFVFFVTPERVLLLTLFSTERTEHSVQSDFVYPDHISFSEVLLTSFLRYLLNNLIRAVSKQKKTFNNPGSGFPPQIEQKTAHQHIDLSGNEWIPVLPPFCFYYIKVVFKERFLYWN